MPSTTQKSRRSASIINVGNGEYHLSVTSNDTGLDNAMTLSVGDDALQSFMGYDRQCQQRGMEVSVAAQNAQLGGQQLVAIEKQHYQRAGKHHPEDLNDVTTAADANHHSGHLQRKR